MPVVPATAAANGSHVAPPTTTGSGTVPPTTQSATSPPSANTPGGSSGGAQPPADVNSGREHAEIAAKNAARADDPLILAVLVLGFTFAVGGVVVVAGRRGGRRVH